MQNIEFKAELRYPDAARVQCEQIGAERLGILEQADTYYRLVDGRLKRREARGEPVEWIFYHRQDRIEPRASTYTILTEAQAHRRWGTQSLTPWLTVRKRRELWMLRNVRIHLDEVERLGSFIEFEAIVTDENGTAECAKSIAHLRETFAPILGEPVSASYSDLLDALMEAEKKKG